MYSPQKMKSLIKNKNIDPAVEFDKALTEAYDEAIKNNKKAELDFVQELVSQHTLSQLNKAAAEVYNHNNNNVVFRAAFLHARPCATYSIEDSNCTESKFRRELADHRNGSSMGLGAQKIRPPRLVANYFVSFQTILYFPM